MEKEFDKVCVKSTNFL